MIFSIIIILAIALVAYFHYAQGFFSATVSAILATLCAVMAVSYGETVVNTLLKGKMADSGQGVMMLLLFFGSYLILRIIFDMAVPGNLRFPAIVDAVGGGIMGIIAGIMATGVVALAAQSMGFGPSIGGYSVFAMHGANRTVVIHDPTKNQQLDAIVTDEVDVDKMDPVAAKTMIVPVDNIVLGLVQHLSDDGSLAGSRSLDSVHPNWPLELFGQRAGIQVGSKRTAINFPPTYEWIKVIGVYAPASLPEVDGELKGVRGVWTIPPVQRSTASQSLLVVRVDVDHAAGDDADGIFRFSTGSVRLVANKKDYFPLGTVYNGTTLLAQKPDDPLFLDLSGGGGAIDFAFMVDTADVLTGGKGGAPAIADGAFISVKRYGIVDLTGMSVKSSVPTPSEAGPVRKVELSKEKSLDTAVTAAASPTGERAMSAAQTATAAPAQAAPPESSAVLTSPVARVSAELPRNIGVTTTDVNAQNVSVAGGTVSLSDSRMELIKIDPTATLDKLAAGDNQIPDLFVPDGKKLIQVQAAGSAADWATKAEQLKLTDAGGTNYPCNGVYAVVTTGTGPAFFCRYDAKNPITGVSQPSGTVTTVTYLFVVPTGTVIKGATGAGSPAAFSVTAQ